MDLFTADGKALTAGPPGKANCSKNKSPSLSCITFSARTRSCRRACFKQKWRRNPSPACAGGCHLPGEKQQRTRRKKPHLSGLLQLPASLSIRRKRRCFGSFPKRHGEAARRPCVTGAVFIRGFSGALSSSGSPRRDPGRISLLRDSSSRVGGARAGSGTLHFSTLIHATPGE